MNEELLRAIIQLFSIVAKERVTEDERVNIKEFLSFQLNQESIPYYVQLFDQYCEEYKPQVTGIEDADDETIEFVDDWARIVEIGKRINQDLTEPQKQFLLLKIIELVLADGEISERQSNLTYYIGEIIKLQQSVVQEIVNFVRGTDEEELNSPHILVVDSDENYATGRPHLTRKNLTGLIAILRIPDTETYFVKYLGISDLNLNGVQLKSRRVSVFATGSTIRGSKLAPIYYSDVVTSFMQEEEETRLSFQAEHISFRFKGGNIGLHDISIAEDGGKLVGIMGASGSGKSTLLSVLNGSEEPSSGHVRINGVDVHKDKDNIEGVIGFVPQDDFLIEELTVYENLFFSARLCFGKHSEKEIDDLVLSKLKTLGLLEIKDLKVGSPLEKTISGGQRKRVNIGLELLREPAVLFVDEPTSGLSSRDSENIMDLLKELSLRGKMIFVVIHQPSSDIYKMFDSMIILDVGGYQIFYGNPLEAVVYFKTRVNMVNKDQSACIECGNVNPEQIFTIIENKVVNEFGRFTDQRKITPKQWFDLYTDQANGKPKGSGVRQAIQSTLELPSRLAQFMVFATRDVKAKLANKQYLAITFSVAPLLALFLSFLVRFFETTTEGEGEYVFRDNVNIPTYFLMTIVVSIFIGLTVSAEEILKDRKILKREAFLNLSRRSYLFAKVGVLFVISAIQALTYVLIGNYILEIKELGFSMWLIFFSCSCFANMTGLNISSAFNSAVTIYILIPLLIIPQLVLSGVVIKFEHFNPRISTSESVPWFGEFMTSRWGFEAIMVEQFTNNRYQRNFFEDQKLAQSAQFKIDYFLTKLESNLSVVRNNLNNTDAQPEVRSSLRILRNSIEEELIAFGRDKFGYLEELRPNTVNSEILDSTQAFIKSLEGVYERRRSDAVVRIGETNARLNDELGVEGFRRLHDTYHND